MPRIKLDDVSDVQKEKKYFYITISYKDNGKVWERKIVSFANKEVYEAFKGAKKGDEFDVEIEKDEAGRWQWVGAKKVEAGSTKSEKDSNKVSAATTRSTYETPEERAKKQVYIVRQSAINAAIELASFTTGGNCNSEYILKLAEQFERWVFRTDPTDLKDDKPWEKEEEQE